MLKNAYKIILIKEGKYDLKQFKISQLHVILVIFIIIALTSSLVILSSEKFVRWAGSEAIEEHQTNNQILIKKIENNQERIDSLLDQLISIKNRDNLLRKLVKLPPIHDDIRKMGFGGSDEHSNAKNLNYLLPDNNINLEDINNDIDLINRLIKLELLSYDELSEKIEENKNNILTYPAIYPIDKGPIRLSSNFGYRRDPFSRKHKFHDGHDFSAPIGTNVYTSANGRVIRSRYLGAFGNYIKIDHGNGYVTSYGHLSSRNVIVGDKVLRGQKIGKVGNTGRSTAPHLHYEIQYQNKAIDPSSFYFDMPIN